MCMCYFESLCFCPCVLCSLMRITNVYKSAVKSIHGDLVQKLRMLFLNNRPQFVRVPTQVISKHSICPSETEVKSDLIVKHQHDLCLSKLQKICAIYNGWMMKITFVKQR